MGSQADHWVKTLHLEAHPEGGYYREIYRSNGKFIETNTDEYPGGRSFSTAIFFLLKKGDISALHRICSDEIWHFYAGSPMHIHIIHPEGIYEKKTLGRNYNAGHMFQVVIPAGCWFGATVARGGDYSLAGCTVAPGFDFRDFELADREVMLKTYPTLRGLILLLTR